MRHLKDYPVSPNTYVYYKCRCDGCRRAISEYLKKMREQRWAERIPMVDSEGNPLLMRNGNQRLYHLGAKHGTGVGAKYHGCHCDACLRWRSENQPSRAKTT